MTLTDPNAHYCFVIHSHRPYCYDFVDILAAPATFEYHQRYDTPWVSRDVQSDPDAAAGKRVLIIFHDAATKALYPVRWGAITNTRIVADVFIFDYTLGPMASYPADTTARSDYLTRFNDTFTGFHNDILSQYPTGVTVSVFRSSIGHIVGEEPFDNLTNWGYVLRSLTTSQAFKDVEFLKLVAIDDASQPMQASDGGFTLSAGVTYRLRLFQIIPNPTTSSPPPHDIQLTAFSDRVHILQHRRRAYGKYDELTYRFKLADLPPGEQTPLEVAPHSPSAPPSAQQRTLYIPITVKGEPVSSQERILRIGGLLLGLALIFIPNISAIPPATSVGLIGFVLAVAGWSGLRRALSGYNTIAPR